MKHIFIGLILLISNSVWSDSTEADWASIIALENARVDAMMTRNVESIDRILSKDIVHITSNGTVRSKPQYLQDFKNSKTPFANFKLESIDVRLYDDIAIANGNYSNSKQIDGVIAPKKHAVFTRVYRKIDNTWTLISHQATEIDEN